jgi:hypothetical protein
MRSAFASVVTTRPSQRVPMHEHPVLELVKCVRGAAARTSTLSKQTRAFMVDVQRRNVALVRCLGISTS